MLSIRVLFLSFGLLLMFGFSACGGGSEGDAVPPANLDIRLEPSRIDTGDRMTVRIFISEVPATGIAVKVLYPSGLVYSEDSAAIEADDRIFDINPQNEDNTEDSTTFLVFYITDESFGSRSSGDLIFVLVGQTVVESGTISVDADLDDPDESNITEFDVNNPQFTAQDEASVVVS